MGACLVSIAEALALYAFVIDKSFKLIWGWGNPRFHLLAPAIQVDI